MNFRYKPINLLFERKSTTKTTPTIGEHTEMIQYPTVVANVTNKMRSKKIYLGVTRQTIARLIALQQEMVEHKKSWKMPQLTKCMRNCVQRIQRIGKAVQQITLLRRCFYPRRDVIKWQHKRAAAMKMVIW